MTTDRTVDTSSLGSVVKGVFERSGAKTDDEKAIAVYEYMLATIYHRYYPVEPAPQTVGPLKVLNAYGRCLCGGEHTVLKALYETAGWPCRYQGWDGHTTVEVFYGGRWHYLDVFLKCYYWSKDRTHIVDQAEIVADPSLVYDAVKDGRAARQDLVCGDVASDVVKGCGTRRLSGPDAGCREVTGRDQGYSPRLDLASGASVRLDWRAEPGGYGAEGPPPSHTCGTKDFAADPVLGPVLEHYGTRAWSDGVFSYAPRFDRPADLAGLTISHARPEAATLVAEPGGPGVVVARLSSPYPFVSARVTLGGPARASVSTDAGKTWAPVDGPDLTPLVRLKYDPWLRVEFDGALDGLAFEGVVEHNKAAQPYLVPGRNVVTVSSDDDALAPGTSAVVTYTFREAMAPDPKSRTRFEGDDLSYGPERVVRRAFAKLPATFEVEVGGNTPPKMVSLERAVVATPAPDAPSRTP